MMQRKHSPKPFANPLCSMERNTLTTVKKLTIGDRFYKAGDKNKTLHTVVESTPLKTFFTTYKYFAIRDSDKLKVAFKPDTQVIFIRNINQ